jgi:hypothetical protein
MSGEVFVLMYHRVCELNAQTACWFARGTAVTPAHFEAQMAWLRARARFVTLAEALAPDGESNPGPRCVVTFDDGYRLALAERHPVLVERVGRLPAPSVRASAEPAKVVTYQGLTVHVDRPIGTVQQGTDEDGQPWSRTYSCDYGYLPRTTGGDGEELDVFLGTDPDATKAHWVVQQKNDGAFDELKLLLGFPSADEARAAYLAHVPEKHLRSLETTSIAQVRALCGVEPGLKAAPAPTTKDAPMESHADAPDLRSPLRAACGILRTIGRLRTSSRRTLRSASALRAHEHVAIAGAASGRRDVLEIDGGSAVAPPIVSARCSSCPTG